MLRFLLPVFLIVLPVSSFAQTISGRIVDPQRQPVAGAAIVVVGATSAPVTSTSDQDGRFSVPALPDGRYDVNVSAPGLFGEARNVSASPAALEIVLRVSAINETLVVSASQVDQPLSRTADSVTVISGNELEGRQITTLGAALTTVPGFSVVRSGGPGTLTSLFPRGGESDFTLVLIDGIRANAFGGGLDLSQIPLADVDRVEIVRGPQSALFGADAIGGVVHVITRQGATPMASAQIEAGSRDTRRLIASTSGAFGGVRWQGGTDYFDEQGFTGTAAANGERVSNDDAQERQVWVGGGWRAERGTDAQATFRYVDTERGAPGPYGSDPARRFSGVDRISRGSSDRRATGLRIVHPWSGPASRVRQRVDVDAADYDLTFISPFGTSLSETRRTHARVQTDASVHAAFGFSAGVEWIDESARSSFITSDDTMVPVERQVIGTFGEARWHAHDRVSVQAGLRAEHITRAAFIVNGFSNDAVTSVNPKVSAAWLVSPSLPGARAWTRLRGAIGTGIRPPDVFEIAFTDNPGLAPERSRSAEIGVTQALASGAMQVEATAFFNRYNDLIISVGSLRDVSRYLTDNVSNARAQGLELGGAWQSGHGLSVRAAYTWLDTEIMAVDNTAQAPSPYTVGDALLRRPRHSGSLSLGWTGARTTLFATMDTRGKALDAEPAFGPSGGLFDNPGRTVVDAGGSIRVHRAIQVHARVLNLLDRRYEEAFGFPAPGRTAFIGVRVAARR